MKKENKCYSYCVMSKFHQVFIYFFVITIGCFCDVSAINENVALDRTVMTDFGEAGPMLQRITDGDNETCLPVDMGSTFQIDLLDIYQISRISISRLVGDGTFNGFSLFVSNGTLFQSSYPRVLCTTIAPTVKYNVNPEYTFCNKNYVQRSIWGRYIIAGSKHGIGKFCEISAYVCTDFFFGEYCDRHCDCADMSEICDKQTGHCFSGKATTTADTATVTSTYSTVTGSPNNTSPENTTAMLNETTVTLPTLSFNETTLDTSSASPNETTVTLPTLSFNETTLDTSSASPNETTMMLPTNSTNGTSVDVSSASPDELFTTTASATQTVAVGTTTSQESSESTLMTTTSSTIESVAAAQDTDGILNVALNLRTQSDRRSVDALSHVLFDEDKNTCLYQEMGNKFQIDLLGVYQINTISIARLRGVKFNGFYLRVSNTSTSRGASVMCTYVTAQSRDGANPEFIRCSTKNKHRSIWGRYIIAESKQSIGIFCELSVYVCSDYFYGESCNKKCQCSDDSEICDKETGFCKLGNQAREVFQEEMRFDALVIDLDKLTAKSTTTVSANGNRVQVTYTLLFCLMIGQMLANTVYVFIGSLFIFIIDTTKSQTF